MASNAQKKKRVQARKRIKEGKARKRVVRANGTTPKFAIHPDKPGRKAVDIASVSINKAE